jgi:hypothetical protein
MTFLRKLRFSVNSLYHFDPESEFRIYDHFEEYEPKKVYTNNVFYHDYGKGKRFYENWLLDVREDRSDMIKTYVLVKEVLSEKEIYELGPYCQCEYHLTHWLNPMRCLICPCCVGCIKSDFPSQYVINKTRDYTVRLAVSPRYARSLSR